MRLSISNIAWEPEQDEQVAQQLRAAGVSAVEVAPTKAWPDVRVAGAGDARAEAARWRGLGLEVVAMQALLFGRPELQLFGSAESRRLFVEHLSHVLALGGAMGAGAHVFGSPRNRRRDGLPQADAMAVAVDVFAELAVVAEQHGSALCLEANPAEYGADFLTSAHEAAELVAAVGRPGLRLHLDTACMQLAGDDVAACVRDYAALVQHVHLSEPELGPVGEQPNPRHAEVVGALAEVGYVGAVSVEMRATSSPVVSVDVAARYAAALLAQAA